MPLLEVKAQVSDDLVTIVSLLAWDRPDVADKFIQIVQSRFRFLAENPFAGRLFDPDDADVSEIRMFPVKKGWPWIIFYKPVTDGVVILRVLDGRRNYKGLLI